MVTIKDQQQISCISCSPGSYVTTLEIFQYVKPEVEHMNADISDRMTTASYFEDASPQFPSNCFLLASCINKFSFYIFVPVPVSE